MVLYPKLTSVVYKRLTQRSKMNKRFVRILHIKIHRVHLKNLIKYRLSVMIVRSFSHLLSDLTMKLQDILRILGYINSAGHPFSVSMKLFYKNLKSIRKHILSLLLIRALWKYQSNMIDTLLFETSYRYILISYGPYDMAQITLKTFKSKFLIGNNDS